MTLKFSNLFASQKLKLLEYYQIYISTKSIKNIQISDLKIKQNKLSTISMWRAPSKPGVFNLLKSLENKGWCQCYAIVGPKWHVGSAHVGRYCRAKLKRSIYSRYKWANTAFWHCRMWLLITPAAGITPTLPHLLVPAVILRSMKRPNWPTKKTLGYQICFETLSSKRWQGSNLPKNKLI